MWPSTNPFAWDVATLDMVSVEPGATAEQQQQLLAAAEQQQLLAGQNSGGRPYHRTSSCLTFGPRLLVCGLCERNAVSR
jgi:hypothetical protein